jgi:hypothetical protein
MRRSRLFLNWAGVLTALWLFANMPKDGGRLKPWLEWAGFPWTFAYWEHGQLRRFDAGLLAVDILVGLAAIVSTAWLCAWSRGRARVQRKAAAPVGQTYDESESYQWKDGGNTEPESS